VHAPTAPDQRNRALCDGIASVVQILAHLRVRETTVTASSGAMRRNAFAGGSGVCGDVLAARATFSGT
jgi:hypothetical protein